MVTTEARIFVTGMRGLNTRWKQNQQLTVKAFVFSSKRFLQEHPAR
jgi:hypothetical protein